MNISEIKYLCKKGKVGMVPGWEGYLKWDYALDELIFKNKDYIMKLSELEEKILDRTDLYYII